MPASIRPRPKALPHWCSGRVTWRPGTDHILKAVSCPLTHGAIPTLIARLVNMAPMTSLPMEPMDRQAERRPRVRSRAGCTDRHGQAGFTLLEVVCVLAIIALLAAIALPAMPFETTLPRLEGYAVEAAALLNGDHAAAQTQHREIVTEIDALGRMMQSGASGSVLRFPSDVTVQALLASRCRDREAGPTIRFLASGLSCGGVLSLTRSGAGYQVRVNWLTGGAEVVPIK
jgi:general secretion pathway protein H